jgi:hypothetical protein
VVFPVGLIDRQIIDPSDASLHRTSGIEFPVLISVRTEPVAAVVMPLISEPHGDAVIVERPELSDKPAL